MADTHDTAPTRFVGAGGLRYAYRRFGAEAGTPIVFLQHFRGGLDHWDPAVTNGLSKCRPVILFNNAGVASSGGQPADSVAGMAAHAITFIEALKLRSVDLLGFSLGGFVAQQIVLDRPGLIRRVILAGTGPQGGEGIGQLTPAVAKAATQPVPSAEDFLYLFFAHSETSRAAGKAFLKRRLHRANQDLPTTVDVMQAQRAAIAAWGSVPKKGRYAALNEVKMPVLIVNGRDDILVPTINSVILQKHIPNATLILYPDSGHGAIFQFSDLFVEHVTTFLDYRIGATF